MLFPTTSAVFVGMIAVSQIPSYYTIPHLPQYHLPQLLFIHVLTKVCASFVKANAASYDRHVEEVSKARKGGYGDVSRIPVLVLTGREDVDIVIL